MTAPAIDTTTPRCGTCFQIAHPSRENEGYSCCCNDRIEYPGEYLLDDDFQAAVEAGEVTR